MLNDSTLTDKTQTKLEELFAAGDIDACDKFLTGELSKLPETPCHRVLNVEIDYESAGGIARRTQPFYSREANRGDVGMLMVEFLDIRYNKKWFYTPSTWSQYDGLDSLHELELPDTVYPPEMLYFWTRLQQGFATRYCSGEFEVEAELARHLVYMKFFQLMQVSAPQMKKVTVPIVIAPEGTNLCMEIHEGKIKTSTGEIKDRSRHEKLFEKRWQDICDKVEEYIGEETPVRFSNYKRTRGGLPIDNLDETAIPGRAVIVADADMVWGGDESAPFESEPIEEPTWLQLCNILHEQIRSTGDEQHVFIEGVDKIGYRKIDGNRVNKYTLLLGS